jgi:hypothetical protein
MPIASIGAFTLKPALLTRTSTRPARSLSSAISASISSAEARSARTQKASGNDSASLRADSSLER